MSSFHALKFIGRGSEKQQGENLNKLTCLMLNLLKNTCHIAEISNLQVYD